MNANTTKKIYANYNKTMNGIEIRYGFGLNAKQQNYNTKVLKLGWHKANKYYFARLNESNAKIFMDYLEKLEAKGYEIVWTEKNGSMKKATNK